MYHIFLEKPETDIIASNSLKSLVGFAFELQNYFNIIGENATKTTKIVSCDYSDKESRRRKNVFEDKTVEHESKVISCNNSFRNIFTYNR